MAATAAVTLTSGCSTIGYYSQAVGGHLSLVQKARPVADWLSDANTPEPLRQRLHLSQRMRDFAVSELKLPDNSSYRRFADLQRSAVVFNVVATPALSLSLKTWCFPVVGCVGYRGYFSRDAADALAATLRAEGLDVNVYGVPAYSTLGWTNWLGGDPLLSTFINWPEGELARLVFHELAHQVAYADDDTTFNESFATAVERLGGQRWLSAQASPAVREEDGLQAQRRLDFRALTQSTRSRLLTVFESAQPDTDKQRAKVEVMTAFRAEYETLKTQRWGGFRGYDAWMARANNASFGVQAAYDELVPSFERLFEQQGRDFQRFYERVQVLAKLPKDQRRAQLAAVP